MASDTPRGKIELFEDFVVDNGSGSSGLTETASTASMDVLSKHGGWMRLTTTTGDGGYAILTGERVFEVDEGHPLILEVRLQCNLVANAALFVGFTDATGDTGAAIMDEDGTLTATATDAFGFMLEGEQDTTWQAVAVDSDALETQVALTEGADAANSTIQTLRLEANPNDSGTVKYFIDGKLVSTQTGWFDSSIVYCPVVGTDERATATLTDVDYIYAMAPRS